MAEELGTKDVLEQVDARLGTLEQDVRTLDTKVDARFDRVQARMDARFDRMHHEIDGRFGGVHAGINGLRSDVNGRLDKTVRWLVGIIFASWLTLMASMASIWLKL